MYICPYRFEKLGKTFHIYIYSDRVKCQNDSVQNLKKEAVLKGDGAHLNGRWRYKLRQH